MESCIRIHACIYIETYTNYNNDTWAERAHNLDEPKAIIKSVAKIERKE